MSLLSVVSFLFIWLLFNVDELTSDHVDGCGENRQLDAAAEFVEVEVDDEELGSVTSL